MARRPAGNLRPVGRNAFTSITGRRKSCAGGRPWIKWVFLLPILAFLTIQVYFFLQIWWWVGHDPVMTSFMREQLAVLQMKNPKAVLQKKWMPYERISNNLKRAIIASELGRSGCLTRGRVCSLVF